jgi:hypothetical protein
MAALGIDDEHHPVEIEQGVERRIARLWHDT